jgi:hypothetical protein
MRDYTLYIALQYLLSTRIECGVSVSITEIGEPGDLIIPIGRALRGPGRQTICADPPTDMQ